MDQNLVNEIWNELKRYINVVDRSEAAEQFVNILIDNDWGPDDIKKTFAGDSDIKRGLSTYLDGDKVDEDEQDDEFDDESYNDWDE